LKFNSVVEENYFHSIVFTHNNMINEHFHSVIKV
jgi:hypothetical protein